jgi:type VI protein secretion system component VasK
MRWFFISFATVTAVLFLSFVAWIVTRVMHADAANYVVGRIMIYDLYAVGVILAYSAFVGGWHLWEKLTGRMEAEASADREESGRG